MKDYKIYLKEYKERLMSLNLIETFNSERYGNYIEFENKLNMNYVDNFKVITGKEKENFIDNLIENSIASCKYNLDKEIDKLNRILEVSSKYIDITPYLNKIKGYLE